MKVDVLTVKQVSQRLGIGLNQAYEACDRKQIPCVRFGRRYLIPAAAFERWLLTCAAADPNLGTPTRGDGSTAVDHRAEKEAAQ